MIFSKRLWRFLVPALSLTLPLAGAAAQSQELVLQENTHLVAITPSGRISIRAGKKFDRWYSWGQCTLRSHMQARSSRWLGNLGIYDPAGSFLILSTVLPWWFKCDGISRTVVDEGQIHFANQSTAETWLARYAEPSASVWTNDGLLVRWDITKEREQINVDLWQICIHGRRPIKLPGAHDQAITVTTDDVSKPARHECAVVSDADIQSTLQQWTDSWKEMDEWRARK
jgi:hypothetical protein